MWLPDLRRSVTNCESSRVTIATSIGNVSSALSGSFLSPTALTEEGVARL